MSSLADDTTPAVCDTCLGSNPYLEMKRLRNGAECKICSTPFTVFKWNADKSTLKGKANLRKTVICLTCSRARNCCQSCLLDLTFGIDVETRDRLLKIAKLDSLKDINSTTSIVSNAKNITSRLYNSRQLEQKFENEQVTHLIDNEESQAKLKENLEKLIQEKEKVKEKDKEKDKATSKQELVDTIKQLPFNGNMLSPPKNPNVKSFFIFGIPNSLTIQDIKSHLTNMANTAAHQQQQIIISDTVYEKEGKFAFVVFQSRQIAEQLAETLKSTNSSKLPSLLLVNNCPLRICWATNNIHLKAKYPQSLLSTIATIVDKQIIKISKQELSTKNITNSKISKPKHKHNTKMS